MQLKTVIIDDEPLALEIIKQYMQQLPSLVLLQSFDDAITGKQFLESNTVDLLFIDINMPDIKGTDLVRSLANKPLVIFSTAYKSHALEGFELDAVDYLVKPIAFERFSKAVQKAVEVYHYKKAAAPEVEAIFVRSEYQLVKISLAGIEYIESVEDYIKIHLSTGRPVMTLMTMKAILDKLPPNRFVRIHRSYIIPLAKIRSVVNRKVNLSTIELPIGNSYADVVKGWVRREL